jgi:fructokinase
VVLCLGEALVDFVSAEPVAHLTGATAFEPRFGGSQANIAVGASRFGASSALAGCAGADPWGHWLRDALVQEGVEASSFMLRDGVQTQHAFVAVSADGEPEFSFFGGSPDGCLPPAGELVGRISADTRGVLVFGSDGLIAERDRAAVMELKGLALSAGWQVLFDPNFRAARWPEAGVMREVAIGAVEGVTVVKTNAIEALTLTETSDPGKAARALRSLGARGAIVTIGAGGAILARNGIPPELVPARAKRVVDATGAGDAVAAVVAAALARGGELTAEVVGVAMEAAARVVGSRGALTGLPPAAEASTMLGRYL